MPQPSNKRAAFFCTLIFAFLLTSCLQKKSIQSVSGQTMGTTYSIKYVSSESLPALKQKVDGLLRVVNQQMSTYIPDSEISKFNKHISTDKFPVSPWFAEVTKTSLEIAKATDGIYDPTVGPLVELWGFGAKGRKSKPPTTGEVQSLLKTVGYSKLSVIEAKSTANKAQQLRLSYITKSHPKVALDLSSSAKGFAVDKVSELLAQQGLKNYLIEIGGEMRAAGRKVKGPWKVAIEKPTSSERSAQTTISLDNLSIATSGNYRNFFKSEGKTYSHTIDPKTGLSVQNRLLSATVLHSNCMYADAYATALMTLGTDKAKQFIKTNKLNAMLIYTVADDSKTLSTFESESFKKEFLQ